MLSLTVVPNGVGAEEMVRVEPTADAADLVNVGEFRRIKGADLAAFHEGKATLEQAQKAVSVRED